MTGLYELPLEALRKGTAVDGCSPDKRAEFIDDTLWSRLMNWEELLELARYVRVFRVDVGKEILQEGSNEQFFCLLVAGLVKISKKDDWGADQTLDTVYPGRTIGEMAVVDLQPRSASALAKQPCVVVVMQKTQLDELTQDHPTIAVKVLHSLCSLLSQRLRQVSSHYIDVSHT